MKPRSRRLLFALPLAATLLVGFSPSTLRAEDAAAAGPAAPAAGAVGAAARAQELDAFWAQRLAEFRVQPLNERVKLWQETDGIKVYVVYYDSTKGVRLHGYLAVPAGAGTHPGLVSVPGLGGHGDADWALEGARRGYVTLCCDLRGQGKSKGALRDIIAIYLVSRPEEHFYTGCIADVIRGIDLLAARPEVDTRWLFLEGFSLGGGLTLTVTGLDPRIKAAAIGAPAFCDVEAAARNGKDTRSLPLRLYINGLKDPEEGYRGVAMVDNLNFAPRLNVPVLFGMSRRDPVIDYAGVRKVYERVATADKQFIETEAQRHTPPPGFFERADQLFRRVRGEAP
ncbi:MAG: acetylxylan esterase [Planctomycetes bacterium]|nr:acetylxylan esterase [Planctomycetota bacterium]